MGILKRKIKKYNKYVIEIENEDIKANDFENIEDVVIISKKDYENELQKSKELNAKLHSRDLEVKLKELKLQEKDIEIQKSKSRIEELEETHKSELNMLENKYIIESGELKQLMENKESEMEEFKKELENKTKSLQNELEEAGDLQKQIEVYRIGNVGLKNEIKSKEEEVGSLKSKYNKMLDLKLNHEKEIEKLQSNIDRLEKVQLEHNKLINNYRHLQEVTNKKDRTISELEAKKRKLDQYLSMSLEAINTLKNLGLFNRLFNRVPEGIDELQEDIKKLQPPKEIEIDSAIEIEPIRAKKTTDILGEKE